jgi:hypothetical protein
MLFHPGGTTVSRIATLHMLRLAISDSLRSRGFIISLLYHTPHATAVYASCSALLPPHATLASRRPATALPGPDLHRLIAPALAGAFLLGHLVSEGWISRNVALWNIEPTSKLGLFHLDLSRLDHSTPFVGFVRNELCEIGR